MKNMSESWAPEERIVGEKIETEFAYNGPESFPRAVTYGGKEFRLRNRNLRQETAMYHHFVRGEGAAQDVEILVINKNGGVVMYS